MFEKFLEKKYRAAAVVGIITLAAFAVRAWHFHDWLYFKMDQARDAFTISNAVLHGAGELPLLGARAGATEVTYGFLNLGPIFYYFQYLSGAIFHSIDPAVFAYPDLFFGVAVVPIIYLFARIYFKRPVSVLIAFLYAFSFLIIEYSRFAWNPNSLPFFTVLSFFSLLKFFHPEKETHKKWWIILWATGLAVGSQLHFVGFFSLVGVSGLMFLYNYKLWQKEKLSNIFKKEVLKKVLFYVSLAAVVFLVFYTPVIVSDSMKNWENSKNFVEALSSKPSDNTFWEKFSKNFSQETRYYTLITTAHIYNPKKMSGVDYLPAAFTLAIFLAGIYLAVGKIRSENDERRQNFWMLILLWFFVYFILCVPLAYSIRPRFFLFTFAVPFLFAGIVVEYLIDNSKMKHAKTAALALGAVIFLGNAAGTRAWFREQSLSQKKHLDVKRTLILKNKDGVTLGQLQRAADYIYKKRKGDSRIYFYVKNEHVRPVKYLLWEKDPALSLEQMKINKDPKAQFFAIIPSDYETGDVAKKVGREFNLVSKEDFGQISVWEIDFPEREVSQDFEPKKDSSDTGRRVFWKDVFGQDKNSSTPDYGAESAQDIQDALDADSGD